MYALTNSEKKPFEFKIGENVYKVTQLGNLPLPLIREMRDLRTADGFDMAVWVIDNVFEKEAPGSTDGLTVNEAAELVGAWLSASDISAGK